MQKKKLAATKTLIIARGIFRFTLRFSTSTLENLINSKIAIMIPKNKAVNHPDSTKPMESKFEKTFKGANTNNKIPANTHTILKHTFTTSNKIKFFRFLKF